MTGGAPPAPDGIDPAQPSPARVYDCFLGGTHNFAADREVAALAVAAMPELPTIMRMNRAFLRRAVRAVAREGVDQFIDVGSGIPTQGTVHEVARAVNPAARVVYVDSDPTAVIHSRAIIEDDAATGVLRADLQEPDEILAHPTLTRLIDPSRPVCLLMVAVLHFVPDNPRLYSALTRYREALAPGSYLVFSHGTSEGRPVPSARVSELYERVSAPLVLRDRAAMEKLLLGWDLVPPGLVHGVDWHPDPDDRPVSPATAHSVLVAVGRKP